MEEDDKMPSLGPVPAAHRAWANSVVRATIIEQSSDATLLTFLRISQDTFRLAVAHVYRVMPNFHKARTLLQGIADSVSTT